MANGPKEIIDGMCKFRVGEIVGTLRAVMSAKLGGGLEKGRSITPFQVMARGIQENEAGIAVYYWAKALPGDFQEHILQMSEMELVPWESDMIQRLLQNSSTPSATSNPAEAD